MEKHIKSAIAAGFAALTVCGLCAAGEPAPAAGSGRASGADQDKRYSTSCRMDDYYAYGIVTNHSRKTKLIIDGDVQFRFYDEDGDETGNAEENGSETISRGDSEEVAKHYYPNDTKTCQFEVYEAARWEGEDDEAQQLSSSCDIRNGKAYGYIHNGGRTSVRVSGRVTWYFYEDDGDEAGSDSDRVTETIGGGDTELVAETSAPHKASSCSLDISALQ